MYSIVEYHLPFYLARLTLPAFPETWTNNFSYVGIGECIALLYSAQPSGKKPRALNKKQMSNNRLHSGRACPLSTQKYLLLRKLAVRLLQTA